MISKLKILNTLSFIEANKIILSLCNDKIKLKLEEIDFILNSEHKELVNTFFNEYAFFSNADFNHIEKYINLNIDDENKNFVSDLIYFAMDFGLDLEYKKIISFLKIENEDEDCFVLACLNYLSKNIKLIYVKSLIENLEYIQNCKIYHQNEQVLASIILFRITQKSDYLDFIKELIKFDDSNFEFLINLLKEEIYQSEYFNLKVLTDKFPELNGNIGNLPN